MDQLETTNPVLLPLVLVGHLMRHSEESQSSKTVVWGWHLALMSRRNLVGLVINSSLNVC